MAKFNTTQIIGASSWDGTYSTVNTNSADWSYVAANSAHSDTTNGESAYTTLNSNSADWAYVAANSAHSDTTNGESSYTTVNTNSADWSYVAANSAHSDTTNGESAYTTVNTNSADWSYVAANSSSGGSDVSTLSSNWESTYNTVQSNSANWENDPLSLSALDYTKWSYIGDGAKTDWNIAGAVTDVEEAYQVTFDNVIQNTSTYTIILSSETIQFSTAPQLSSEIAIIETQAVVGREGVIGVSFDGITVGEKDNIFPVPAGGTINRVEMVADITGSAEVDIWVAPYSSYPPTSANSIVGSAYPTLSSEIKSVDNTLTGWTTTLSRGDYIKYKVNSTSTITNLTLTLFVTYN